MLDLRIKIGRRHVPLFDLGAAIGRKEAAREVGGTIDGLIQFLAELGGDPDLEDGADGELSGDEKDVGWAEWHTRGRHKLAIGEYESRPSRSYETEDQEPDGDELDGSLAEDDFVDHCAVEGAGCPLADPGGGAVEDEGEERDPSHKPVYGVDQTKAPIAFRDRKGRVHPLVGAMATGR